MTTIANKPKKEEKKPDADKKPDEDKKPDADKKPDDKKPDDKKDPAPKTIASMILVLDDAGSAPDGTDPKKKKKNN